jgi:hypothetical protein
MSQWVLTANGQVRCVCTLRKLAKHEIDSPIEQQKRGEFDNAIKRRLGDSISLADIITDQTPIEKPVDDPSIPEADDIGEPDDYDQFLDQFLGAEVLLAQDGEHMQSAQVVKRVVDENGRAKGSYNSNPMLNTRVYEVMFPDGELRRYSANVIAENMHSQVDSEGYQYQLLDEIVAHRSNRGGIDQG